MSDLMFAITGVVMTILLAGIGVLIYGVLGGMVGTGLSFVVLVFLATIEFGNGCRL